MWGKIYLNLSTTFPYYNFEKEKYIIKIFEKQTDPRINK